MEERSDSNSRMGVASRGEAKCSRQPLFLQLFKHVGGWKQFLESASSHLHVIQSVVSAQFAASG